MIITNYMFHLCSQAKSLYPPQVIKFTFLQYADSYELSQSSILLIGWVGIEK